MPCPGGECILIYLNGPSLCLGFMPLHPVQLVTAPLFALKSVCVWKMNHMITTWHPLCFAHRTSCHGGMWDDDVLLSIVGPWFPGPAEIRRGSRASWVSLKLCPKDIMPMGHIDFPSSKHQIACNRSTSTKVDGNWSGSYLFCILHGVSLFFIILTQEYKYVSIFVCVFS